jgi:hypothetical protein
VLEPAAGRGLDARQVVGAEGALARGEGEWARGGQLLGEGQRAGLELGRRHQLIGQVPGDCVGRPVGEAAEEDLSQVAAGAREPDRLERRGREGDADLDLGEPHLELAVGDEAEIGGGGEHRAAGNRVAVDRGDDRLLEGEQSRDDVVEQAGEGFGVRRGDQARHLEQIEAGGEEAAGPGQDHGARVVGAQGLGGGGEVGEDRAAERVGWRVVEGEEGDGAAALDGNRGHAPILPGRRL